MISKWFGFLKTSLHLDYFVGFLFTELLITLVENA